jgi:hypothetical protein
MTVIAILVAASLGVGHLAASAEVQGPTGLLEPKPGGENIRGQASGAEGFDPNGRMPVRGTSILPPFDSSGRNAAPMVCPGRLSPYR